MGLMNTHGFPGGNAHVPRGRGAGRPLSLRGQDRGLMIGALFLLIALFFGKVGIALLSCIPNAFLGNC